MSVPVVECKRLPNRRSHPDGHTAELFGTSIETQARDAAITASLYPQQGGPPETLRRALTRNNNGSASGPLGRLLDLLLVADGGGSDCR